MDDLVQFLRNRLDDDEATARRVPPNQAPVELRALVSRAGEEPYLAIDPARVLAEVDAKRRIIEWHTGQRDDKTPWGKPVVICYCGYDLPCSTLRLLALPYADHPDYQDEWRP